MLYLCTISVENLLTYTLNSIRKVIMPGFVKTHSMECYVMSSIEYVAKFTSIGHIVTMKHGVVQG